MSNGKLARFNGLGQIEQIYDLGEYALHHDIGFGQEGEILALAELEGSENVEDLVISIDMETGEVQQLIDFKEAMSGYYEMTRPITAADEFFWQAGDERFWTDTPYADYCLEKEGDFVPQYGQHCVEYLYDGDEEGVYYLAVYNNNYWSLNSRDDFELDLAESVGTDLYGLGNETSQVYVYKIDENNDSFSLAFSFDVPYSSIVSNGSAYGDSGHWVVNSGVSKVFGEYDAEGKLIREFSYECDMQNYRVFKYDFTGVWFR